MIELEKKLLLTREEYDCLIEHLGHGRPIVKQVNYYFDTENLSMNCQNITCRVRLKNGKYKATMKRHTAEKNCSAEIDMAICNGIDENAFVDLGLKLQGELTTERCVLMKDEACEVVLDKNEYLGYTDYELEIEYSPDHEQEATAILQSIIGVLLHHDTALTLKAIALHGQNTHSKSRRFFERRIKDDFHF